MGPLFSLNPDRVLLTGQASLSIVRCPFEMTRVRWGRPGGEGKGREGVARGWGWGGCRGGVDTERAGHVSRAVLVACLHVRHPLTSSHPTFRRVVTGGKVVGCVRWGRKKVFCPVTRAQQKGL